MDSIRHAVETSVRRIVGIGLLAIGTLVFAAGARWRLDLTALLLAIEALALWQLGWAAPMLPLERAPAWLFLPGSDRRRRAIYTALLAEVFRAYAGRLAAAGLAWAAALAAHLAG